MFLMTCKYNIVIVLTLDLFKISYVLTIIYLQSHRVTKVAELSDYKLKPRVQFLDQATSFKCALWWSPSTENLRLSQKYTRQCINNVLYKNGMFKTYVININNCNLMMLAAKCAMTTKPIKKIIYNPHSLFFM